ncbi:phosphomannomutase [Halomicrobium mukohataei]|uniref:Phosphomannomutase n=1 Tax=Halomicrobium mukohataei TaxID=57705 RepID=A0A847U5T4_9EURY|nr:phosphopentomutase/phosphoglucosamine mutase [Halomicrobium mukohataei]NLV11063.1 phosphomannomutase [Halomicrobium mukohataei]
MELFGTAGIRGTVAETVTPERALRVGQAVGRDGAEFVVGLDGRVTGPALAAAVESGIESAGGSVVHIGQCPTPALAYASQGRRGVMLTASHNPPEDNGIKLFVDGSEYDREAEQRIEGRVAAGDNAAEWSAWGDTERATVLDEYRDAVAAYAADHGNEPLDVTVAVDCGNGMGALATPQVLRALGADVRALEASVDGYFPARQSKPTPESLAALRSFVADTDAAFGIGHDGDADRIVIVDGDGDVVHEDTVLAILAEHYVRRSSARDPVVVTTPNASGRIDERVDEAGGRVERIRLGALHEGIAAAEGTVVFAAEPWKHVHTAFGGWIDGVASAAVLTTLIADVGLDALREPVTERPYRKHSVDCPDEHKTATMERLATTLPETFPEAAVETEYGVRLTFPDDSWTLVRPSGTEPYVRVYAESDDVDDLVERVAETVEQAVATAA